MTRLRQLRGDRNERNFRATIDAMQPWDSEQDSHARVVASGRFPVKPVQKQDKKMASAVSLPSLVFCCWTGYCHAQF
jgi:hypothetical protein